jgi:tetratricopeptide (TPR) repeat protein
MFLLKRLFFYLLILTFSIDVGYEILSIWRGVYLFQAPLSKEVLFKALRLQPMNPDSFYRLGLFYQWDIRNIDLKNSLHYFSQAIERNPLEQTYWINVAKVLKRMGDQKAFERAVENAILVFPTSYQGRWVLGTLLLQQGELEKALPHFSYILAHYPDQSSVVYDLWSKVINETDFILEKLIPKELASFNQYLSYLYGIGDSESAKKVWQKKVSLGFKTDRSETLRYIEFLISHSEANEALQVWMARLQEEELPISSDGNLVTNGGFEKEKLLGGGFDWKIENVSGAKVSFDQSVSFEGKSSLKIVFDGKENVDFRHIYQYVVLKPNADYLLKVHMKTKFITTKSGPRIEVTGVGQTFYGASESLIGDNEWKELSVAFRTPAQSNVGLIRVRRERTDKFDRFISGTVWLDNFQLKEASQ